MTVHLEPSTRIAAVLKIFRDQARGAGDTMSAYELRCAWTHTGLRRADLEATVRELIGHGLMRRSGTDAEERYELTPEGAELLSHPKNDLLTRVVDWWFLELARRRPHSVTAGGEPQCRRAGDPEAPASA